MSSDLLMQTYLTHCAATVQQFLVWKWPSCAYWGCPFPNFAVDFPNFEVVNVFKRTSLSLVHRFSLQLPGWKSVTPSYQILSVAFTPRGRWLTLIPRQICWSHSTGLFCMTMMIACDVGYYKNVLYTPHVTLHTLNSTLHTLRSTLNTPHFKLHTPHSTLYIHTLHSTPNTLQFTLHTPHFTLHTLVGY